MKLILSRKGFDASAGGVPSPILPDGTLCTLPIPEPEGGALRYADIGLGELGEGLSPDYTFGRMVEELTADSAEPRTASDPVHLDPDLRASARPRAAGWRAAFGQDGAAARHLDRHGVKADDLFLFFGWFRRTALVDGRLRYVAGEPDRHVIFGWLQVGEVIDLAGGAAPPAWVAGHPHVGANSLRFNRLYVARERLSLAGADGGMPGAGVFRRFDERLVLTKKDSKVRSLWRLPTWLGEERVSPRLTYHGSPSRWTACDDHVELRSGGRGQEFVPDVDRYSEAERWASALLRETMMPPA